MQYRSCLRRTDAATFHLGSSSLVITNVVTLVDAKIICQTNLHGQCGPRLSHGNVRHATVPVDPIHVLLCRLGSLFPQQREVGIRKETQEVQDSDASESLSTTQHYDVLPIAQLHGLLNILAALERRASYWPVDAVRQANQNFQRAVFLGVNLDQESRLFLHFLVVLEVFGSNDDRFV
jgi:hypothetical protein